MRCCLSLVLVFAMTATLSAETLESAVAGDYEYLAALYRHLHQYPELSFDEVETAARMAAELGSLDFAVTTGFGGHGVVAVLANGVGPTVMIRTDLDGLPIQIGA